MSGCSIHSFLFFFDLNISVCNDSLLIYGKIIFVLDFLQPVIHSRPSHLVTALVIPLFMQLYKKCAMQ